MSVQILSLSKAILTCIGRLDKNDKTKLKQVLSLFRDLFWF